MNLFISLNRAVTLWPNREAVVDGDKRFTYKQFGARVSALAAWMVAAGMNKGSVAAIIAPNCHEFMEAYYACAALGVILNPINFRLAAREIATILEDSEATLLFAHDDFHNVSQDAIGMSKDLQRVVWIGNKRPPAVSISAAGYEDALSAYDGEKLPDRSLVSDDLAHLYYTSGTTGKPKGVMLTQGNVAYNALGAIAELSLNDSDTWAHVAPIFHLADAWSIFAITWVGGKHVYLPYFQAPHVLELFIKEKVTVTTMVPTMVNALLNEPNVSEKNFPNLRLIMTAGSPVAPEQVKKMVTTFTCDYIQFYGLTETSPFLTVSVPKSHMLDLPADKLLEIKSRTGRPFIGVELKIVHPDGTEVENNDKDVGEIIARGPHVTTGYWKQPDTTAAAIKNGWFHTGDLAVIDEEGYVNIVDRKKDMIISGGENVYSTEVEYTLYEHPGVKECAVFGVPDDKWGELVKAVVVLKEDAKGVTDADLIAFVKQRLASYKSPRSIDFADELPKTGSGKIYKKGLREKYWKHLEKQVH